MRKLLLVALPLFLFSCKASGQIGTVKTEEYQADFEKRQSMAVVSDYTDTIVIPIQVLKIGINEELYDMCQSYFEKAGLSKKIIQHIGNAADIIPRIDCIFDLVFIDADKQNYHLYYDLVIDRLPIGAYILADNVLYDGEVLLAQEEQSKNAKAIQAFNEKIRADKRVIQVLLPIRDGLLLMKKISD